MLGGDSRWCGAGLLHRLLSRFGSASLVVKDYVKSQKHYWSEACFIPDASRSEDALRVIRRFIALQGGRLEGGLVLREFVPLAPAGTHPKSGMPLSREWRLFLLDGEVLTTSGYWTPDDAPPAEVVARMSAIAARVPARLLSMDIARTAAGGWTIVEVGSGQVSGLPEALSPVTFHEALAAVLGSA